MIYFVDEEFGEFHPYLIVLEMQGFEVDWIPNAVEGLARLSQLRPEDACLVFLDVMLARGSDGHAVFPKDGLTTGLRLLDLLSDRNPSVFPKNAILLSAAEDSELVHLIARTSNRHSVPFWRKSHFASTSDFVASVEKYLGDR